MTVLIGTSGWNYRDWRGSFYPDDLRTAEWLAYYAARFRTVEVNNSFYRLPPREQFEAWAKGTPDDFVLCPKVSRFLSHMKKLSDPEEPVKRFAAAVAGCGEKLGPALLQLPGNFTARPDRLDRVLGLFGRRLRVAVELRHDSWFTDEVREILSRHDAPLVWADRRNHLQGPLWRTATWGFVRLHEGVASPRPCYGDQALRNWAERIADGFGDDEVWMFFNNDPNGCAPHDAVRFTRAGEKAGLSTSRVPQRPSALVES